MRRGCRIRGWTCRSTACLPIRRWAGSTTRCSPPSSTIRMPKSRGSSFTNWRTRSSMFPAIRCSTNPSLRPWSNSASNAGSGCMARPSSGSAGGSSACAGTCSSSCSAAIATSWRAVYAARVSDEEKREGKRRVFEALKEEYQQMRKGPWAGFAGYDRWFSRPLGNAHLGSGCHLFHLGACLPTAVRGERRGLRALLPEGGRCRGARAVGTAAPSWSGAATG